MEFVGRLHVPIHNHLLQLFLRNPKVYADQRACSSTLVYSAPQTPIPDLNMPGVLYNTAIQIIGKLSLCPKHCYTYRVLMARRGVNSPLLMVCSLLSYSDSTLRFCRSWKVLTLKQFILLAFNNLKDKQESLRCFIYLCFISFIIIVHKTKVMQNLSFSDASGTAKPLLFFPVLFLISLCLPLPLPSPHTHDYIIFCL